MSLLWGHPDVPMAASWGCPPYSTHTHPPGTHSLRDGPQRWGCGSGCWGPRHGGLSPRGVKVTQMLGVPGMAGSPPAPCQEPPGSSQVSPSPLQSLPVLHSLSQSPQFHPLVAFSPPASVFSWSGGGGGTGMSPSSSPNRSQNMPGRTTSHGHPQATDSRDALVSLLSKPILGTPQPEASPRDVMLVSPITRGGDTGRHETLGRRQLSASGRGRVGAPSCAGWSGPS